MMCSSSCGRRVAALLLVLVVSAVPVLAGPSPAGAADNGQFGVFPTSTATAANRPFFQLALTPGLTLGDSVTVLNRTDAEISFNLYAADAINTPTGEFSLKRRTDPKESMGAWIKLPVDEITLKPKTQADIPFTISVPTEVEPGDHTGGIAIETKTGKFEKAGDLGVSTLAAVGTRVYGRVQGALAPGIAITDMTLTPVDGTGPRFGGPVESELTYTVVNTGNLRVTPEAVTEVTPLFGGGTKLAKLTIPELLPHGRATVRQSLSGVLSFGRLTAKVSLTSTENANVEGEVSAWILPIYLIALLVLVLVIVWFIRWRRRRRARVAEGDEWYDDDEEDAYEDDDDLAADDRESSEV